MPTVEDLGKLVKEKYPTDAYKAMSDADLGRAVKAKYPGTAYDRYEDSSSPTSLSTTPTGLSSISSSPKTPSSPDQPGTLKGVGQHIVGGAISSVPEIGLQAGKLLLSAVALPEKMYMGHADETTQAGLDWINDKQKKIGEFFESTYTAPDMNFSLGPLGKIGVGSTIGGIIPFAAAGSISAASKAAKAADVAVPVYEAVLKAMGHGAAFSGVYELPNIIAAKTWKEAEEKAKEAGVSITLSALMAGAFTGTGEGFKWAKEKMGKTPAERVAKAQVMVEENALPNTEKLGANQPAVTPVDEVHADIFDKKVKDKAARLEKNVPAVETAEDKYAAVKAKLTVDKPRSIELLPGTIRPIERLGVEVNEKLKTAFEGKGVSAEEDKALVKSAQAKGSLSEMTVEELSALYRFTDVAGSFSDLKAMKAELRARFAKGDVAGNLQTELVAENEVRGTAERARLGIEEQHNAPIEEPPVPADQPPVPKQLDVNARTAENVENMAKDPNSPGMKALGDTLKRAQKMLKVAKDPETKAYWENELKETQAGVDRINQKVAKTLAADQVENAKAAIPPPTKVDKTGKGAPTAGPQAPVDQVGPMERMAQAAIDLGKEAKAAKDLAHVETEVAKLDPTLQGLAKERVVKLRQLGEDFLAGAQDWLTQLQRSVNPISMLTRDARQAFVNFEGRRTEFSMLLNNALKGVNEMLPEKLDRELVTLTRDSAGHQEVLKVPRTPKVDAALGMVDKFYDSMFKIGVDADLFDPKQAIKNFVNRIYSASDAKKIEALMEKQPLDAKNKHSFRRVYQTLEEAATRHKIYPATLDITELMRDYGNSLMRTMTNAQLVRDMIKIMGNDLMWSAEKPRDARWRAIDERLQAGYKETPLSDGKIQVERLYADKDIHKMLESALDANPLKGTVLGKIADLNTRYKSMMLALDIYHLANLTYQRTALNLGIRAERLMGNKDAAIISFKEGLAMFDPEHPKFESTRMIARNGLGLERGDWQQLQSLSVQDVKKGNATFVGKLWESHLGLKYFNKLMWEKYHKGLKMATAVGEFERLLKDPELLKKFTHDELARKAATFANNVYGGQAWSTHGRTAKFNAISRMVLLAPDWFETRMNLAAGLGKIREGGEFKATPEFKMAARYWTGYVAEMSAAAFLGNAAIEAAFPDLKNHKMKEGWKQFTNVVLPVKDGSGHNLVIGLGGSYRYVFDAMNNLGQTLSNRESALLRAGMEFYQHRDWTGKLTGPTMFSKGNLIHFGKNLIPVPLTLRLMDIEFNAAGVANTKNGIDGMKTIMRSLGTHPTTGYPMELRNQAEALKDRRDTVQHKRYVLAEAGHSAMAVQEARDFNKEVLELMDDCKKTYRGDEVAARLKQLLITK